MRRPDDIGFAAWPQHRLGECLQALLQHSGIATPAGLPQSSSIFPSLQPELSKWIPRAASQLGCEAVQLNATHRDLRSELGTIGPALLALGATTYLAVVSSRRSRLVCLAPSGALISIDSAAVCGAIAPARDRDERAQLAGLLANAGLARNKRGIAMEILLDGTGEAGPFRGCWTFRPAAGLNSVQWLKNSGVGGKVLSLFVAHSFQYSLWLLSWALLGQMSMSGRLDRGWLLAWGLLLATAVPCRALATWLQGVIPILIGGELKRRILDGALKLAPDEIRKDGVGSFIGQAFEAESLETLALGGGIAGLLAIVDLGLSAFFLGRLAILLLVWCALAFCVGIAFLRRFQAWSSQRLEMTHDVVEAMVGQRTRLAQLHPRHWHKTEDYALAGYLTASRRVDRVGAFLIAAVPRGWLLASIACLAPQLVAARTSAAQLAIFVGGVLLAFTAFDRLMSSLSEIAAAVVAWRNVSFLFHAAGRDDGSSLVAAAPTHDSSIPVLEADRLEFRYSEHGPAVLQSCSLNVWSGDRVLLEGTSGGGKTTLAALLSGSRQPHSGLLLTGGLDRHSLGAEGWRDRIVSAPQFHDNHILTETLAFNLLMGRRWPASPADFAEADTVCRRLGLAELLSRMPSGLLQMVGDGGWQLSHGERSRIFIARALLQNPELIILDESFGSLDPETLAGALEFTLERANTLVVIAHP